MATDAYEVKRGIIGKPKVAYKCAKCHNDLESDLTDAGKKDTCPFCKAAFIVPGQRELKEIQDAKKQAEAEKTRKDEERRAAEAHRIRQREEWLRLQEEERIRRVEMQRQADATRDENLRATVKALVTPQADRYPGSPQAAPPTKAPDEPTATEIVCTIIRTLFIIIGVCVVVSSLGPVDDSLADEINWIVRGVQVQRDIFRLLVGGLLIGVGIVGWHRNR
jgi:DNA-directed RNA polymerase subunit RPC12/RpoP